MGPPFSVLANMGYIANMPTTDTIKRGSKRDLNKIEFQLNCLKDPEINSAYINQISFSGFHWCRTGISECAYEMELRELNRRDKSLMPSLE